MTPLTLREPRLCSGWQPALGRWTRVCQQGVRRFTQSEACQSLAEFGKLYGQLCSLSGLEVALILTGRRDIGQRFDGHPCIASERKFCRDSGVHGASFKDGAEKSTSSQPLDQTHADRLNFLMRQSLGGDLATTGTRTRSDARCCSTTAITVTLPQSARCLEPWHLSIQSVAQLHLFGALCAVVSKVKLLCYRLLSDFFKGARLLQSRKVPRSATSTLSQKLNGNSR